MSLRSPVQQAPIHSATITPDVSSPEGDAEREALYQKYDKALANMFRSAMNSVPVASQAPSPEDSPEYFTSSNPMSLSYSRI